MNRSLVSGAGFAIISMVSTVGCTGGMVTMQDGSKWSPYFPGGVVTFSNNTGSYQVWADAQQNDTLFSFDPYAPVEKDNNGVFTINNPVAIPNGTYTVTVADRHVWQASNVTVNNAVACPYTDFWNNRSGIDCQLFNLELLDCNVNPVPPYQSGNTTTVQMAQLNSGQCGYRYCQNYVQNVAGAVLVNPVIEEIYWGCPKNAPQGCQKSPNTGLWPGVAGATEFWSRMVEYGVGNGRYFASFNDTPANVGTYVSDSDIKTALLNELAAGTVTTPYDTLNQGNAVIFVIYLPTTSCVGSNGACANQGGHHWSFTSGGQHYYFGVINGSTNASFLDAVATHEVAEAATDADPYNPGCGQNTGCGWNEPNTNQGEIGDLCGGNETIQSHTVAQVWSQARCTCL